jgi:hypothetical protein
LKIAERFLNYIIIRKVMNKRGQFTLFVVLGIVVVIILGLVFYFQSEILSFVGISSELTYPSEVQEVADHVQECVDTSAYEAVSGIGSYGGYYTLPVTSYYDEDLQTNIPYYLYDGTNIIISKEEIQENLNDYVEFVLSPCIDFTQFTDMSISAGELSVSSIVNEEEVEIVVEYPLTVTIEDQVYILDKPYSSIIQARLGALYDIAANIVDANQATEEIDYTALQDYGLASIVVAPVNKNTILYILKDDLSFNGEAPLIFMFAEYYPGYEDIECIDDIDCSEGTCVDGVCEVEE